MNSDAPGPAQDQRQHFWDALRAFLMLLGIPYHAALAYRPEGKDWIVLSHEGSGIFTYLAETIHIFRMPAFFLVAGFFAAMLLSRRAPGDWLGSRFERLIAPFFATIVLLVPVMNLICELSNLPPRAALASWRDNSLHSGGYWIRHLWFIVVLLYCSAAAAWLARRSPRLARAKLIARIDRWLARNFTLAVIGMGLAMGLWEAVAVELFYIVGLATNLPQQILRLEELIQYAPWFALGAFLSRTEHLRFQLSRFSPDVAALALLSVFASLWYMDALWAPIGRFVATFAAVTSTQVLIAAARRFANRPMPAIQRLVAASFVIYLFHMPIVIALVELGTYVPVPVVPKAFAVMALTLLLSYGAWLVIERSRLLLFLFDGRRMTAEAQPRPSPA